MVAVWWPQDGVEQAVDPQAMLGKMESSRAESRCDVKLMMAVVYSLRILDENMYMVHCYKDTTSWVIGCGSEINRET